MATWPDLVHPPRPDGTAITEDQAAIMTGTHSAYIQGLFDEGRLILAGRNWAGTLDNRFWIACRSWGTVAAVAPPDGERGRRGYFAYMPGRTVELRSPADS